MYNNCIEIAIKVYQNNYWLITVSPRNLLHVGISEYYHFQKIALVVSYRHVGISEAL